MPRDMLGLQLSHINNKKQSSGLRCLIILLLGMYNPYGFSQSPLLYNYSRNYLPTRKVDVPPYALSQTSFLGDGYYAEGRIEARRSKAIIEDLIGENKRLREARDGKGQAVVTSKGAELSKQASKARNSFDGKMQSAGEKAEVDKYYGIKYFDEHQVFLDKDLAERQKQKQILLTRSDHKAVKKTADIEWTEPKPVSSKIKQQIFRKLYQQPASKKSPVKKQESPARTITESKQKFDQAVLRQQVKFLKQQLQQKNKIIVNLQCQIIRKSKANEAIEISKGLSKKQGSFSITDAYEMSIKPTLLAAKQLTKMDTLALSISCEQSRVKQENTQYSLGNRREPNLNIEHTLEQSMSFRTINDANLLRTSTLMVPGMEIDAQATAKSIVFNYQTSEQELEVRILQQDAETKTRVGNEPGGFVSVGENSWNQVERISKEVQTAYVDRNNTLTQTSESYYDYIEETYLEWVFDKEFKQLEAKKKQQKLQSLKAMNQQL